MNLTITNFDISIDGVSYDNSFSEDIKVDRTDLDNEFANFAGKYVYYAMLHELAKDLERKLKRELELTYAHVDAAKRMESHQINAQNPKLKFTETMIDNMIKTDQVYQEKEIEYLNSRKMSGLLGAAREAIGHKRDMLISMGANARIGVSELKLDKVRETLARSGTVYSQTEE